ncbi:MAG: hypothetical protein GX220_04110 [Treponema sp.]|nr:hypothetical protein [Treponema sp.]
MKKIFISFFILSIFTYLLLSCSDTTPSIITVHPALIYEYSAINSKPVERLSVFVQPNTEVERFLKMEIENLNTGFTWTIYEPDIIESGTRSFVGSPVLMPYEKQEFPFGEYKLTYTDVASRSVVKKFILKKPASFEKNPIHKLAYKDIDSKKVAKDFIFDRVVLYDENGEIIFYGGQKREFLIIEEVRKYYPEARVMRKYRMVNDNSCGILLAPIYLPEYINKDEEIEED